MVDLGYQRADMRGYGAVVGILEERPFRRHRPRRSGGANIGQSLLDADRPVRSLHDEHEIEIAIAHFANLPIFRPAAEQCANVFRGLRAARAGSPDRVSDTSRGRVHSPSSISFDDRTWNIRAAKDETGVGRILFAVGAELLDDSVHLDFIENADLPESQRRAILRGEIFDLAGERESGAAGPHRRR